LKKKISLFVGQVPRILKKDTGVWGFFKLVKKCSIYLNPEDKKNIIKKSFEWNGHVLTRSYIICSFAEGRIK